LNTSFYCLPTMIGSLPHTDPEKACQVVSRFLKNLPAWPQLPKRKFLEDINVQYSEGFPGLVVKDRRIYVERSSDFDPSLEKLYAAFLVSDAKNYAISSDYAVGLHNIRTFVNEPCAIKGQLVGPVTFGLSVTDLTGKAILYDEVLGDAVPKFLKLKAMWQEHILKRISPNTIIFVDEPYMTSFGSATFSLAREKVITLINEVLQGISGIKGIHCCANTDWSVLLSTETDVISFDTYNFAASFILYPAEIKTFLNRGGAIAWGIVPNTVENITNESVNSLKDRLFEAMAPFTHHGTSIKYLVEHGLVTPSCGLSGLSEDLAELVLEKLSDLSKLIRAKYR
jgi:hypothetical protein